ncbi:MAG: hypothetical protein WA864_07155 [Acetobacteraceae bacterium]
MPAAMHGFRWNEDHYAKLEKLVREGLPMTIIATRLGCTPATVSLRWRELAKKREAVTRETRQA